MTGRWTLAILLLASSAFAAAPPAPRVMHTGNSTGAFALSPDGKRLVAYVHDTNTLGVWDTESGRQLNSIELAFAERPAHLSTDGNTTRWIDGFHAVRLWRHTARASSRATQPPYLNTHFTARLPSPDGKTLAAVMHADRRLRLIPLLEKKSERVLFDIPDARFADKKHSRHYNELFYSPDGRRLAILVGTDYSVVIFDTDTGAQLRKIPRFHPEQDAWGPIAFAPDGRSILRHALVTQVFEVSTGGERFRVPQEDEWMGVAAAAWSRDGRLIALRRNTGKLLVYDTLADKELWSVTGKELGYQIAFSHDGRQLAAVEGKGIRIWRLPKAEWRSTRSDNLAWRELESQDAAIAFQGMRHFLSKSDDSVKWLAERLKAPPEAKAERIVNLIKDLDDDKFEVRRKASEELANIGEPVRAALEESVKKPPSPEVMRRAEALLRRLPPRGTPSLHHLRSLRVVETLEKIGTRAAKEALKDQLKSKWPAEVKASIEAALSRMGKQGP